jgi:hypothetical protein
VVSETYSWRSAADSNHRYGFPYHAITIHFEAVRTAYAQRLRKLPIERVGTKYREVTWERIRDKIAASRVDESRRDRSLGA